MAAFYTLYNLPDKNFFLLIRFDASNMDESDSQPRLSVGRRNVLKSVGGTSAALGTIGIVTGDEGDGTKTIVTIRGKNNKPVKKKEVPKEWYNHFRRIKNTRRQLAKNHGNKDWWKSVGHETTDQFHGGKRGFRIVAEASSQKKSPK